HGAGIPGMLFPLCALSAAWLPALQLVRRGSKAVTRHWKAMHFQRQKLMAVTEYLAPRPAIPPGCLPPKKETLEEVNFVACGRCGLWDLSVRGDRVALHTWCVCFVLGICQRVRSPPRLAVFPQIARPVLSQSKYKNLLPLFVARNILLVSPEVKVKEMLRVLKGVPQVNLLGACIDDTILSRQGVENFAKLPSLEVSQGQTVGALALLPSQTSSLLQRGSAHLTALLDQHIHQLRAGEPGGPTEPSPTQSVGAQ
uniref:Large ribosomal subunit protein uL10m n=1 Tax=Strix occidentalis caurina TaxID=311401 RepID=A0A8D0F0R8_STROC